jgi:hypothetical protein
LHHLRQCGAHPRVERPGGGCGGDRPGRTAGVGDHIEEDVFFREHAVSTTAAVFLHVDGAVVPLVCTGYRWWSVSTLWNDENLDKIDI